MLWINGQQDSNNFVLDDGFWFGRGVFETIRVHDRPLFWTEHINRLNDGLQALKIRPPIRSEELLAQLEAMNAYQCVLKIGVTPENIVFQTRPLPDAPSPNFGILPIQELRSHNPLLHSYKLLNYLDNLLARERATDHGYEDALYIDAGGGLSETARANLFFVRDGQIHTPALACGLLSGVIRQWVIDNFRVETGFYTMDELLKADAVFETNSVIGIQPVSHIEELACGTSPVVEDVRQRYEATIS